jgi:hypothetical protein
MIATNRLDVNCGKHPIRRPGLAMMIGVELVLDKEARTNATLEANQVV